MKYEYKQSVEVAQNSYSKALALVAEAKADRITLGALFMAMALIAEHTPRIMQGISLATAAIKELRRRSECDYHDKVSHTN